MSIFEQRRKPVAAAIAGFATAALVAGCGGGGGDTGAAADGAVTVVTGWVIQPEFASLYAADALGYYQEAGLDVTIQPGGPDVNAEQLVGAGSAQFGMDAGSNVLTSNDVGTGLVSLAQLEQESSLRLLSWAKDGLTTPESWRGKRIGIWSSVNSLYASLAKHGMNKDTDVTLVEQGFDMQQFLDGQLDLASAYSYNEVGQVYQAGVPEQDVLVYNYASDDTDTIGLQLFGNGEYVAANPEQAVDFVAATLRGQAYCRDNPEDCVRIVGEAGSTMDADFMLWQMNEMNKSIWSSDAPLGTLDEAAFQQTADVLSETGVIQNAPDLGALMQTDIYNQAVTKLGDTDLSNATFTPLENVAP
ncbi:ABC transporter substrate-binding protein [Mycolicibacterium tokaiense]|uniref:Thiamine pyrimidine synthase n=1 Tax=Mycolicibacterium tokaiense TaxID=39695 RepID=A0A378TLW6_9MYCO|nr:ABC transporter substrate-binding protein [Mycolicibacterium tokaiense]BBY84729.1 nitrate ABC transporter substrate-binding protein [Mycolicibacterium tokaiense]STZ60765.1 periplasmic substrate-binding protein, ABC-type transporter [Mycolicibacterium tokaiense]